MGLIIKSFFLSFGVFGRMILPILGITVVSSIVWNLLNLVSGGYAEFLSGPINSAIFSLFGIRMALSIMGDSRRIEYQILILYSVFYGIFLFVVSGAVFMISDFVALIYANWQLGEAFSRLSLVNVEKSLVVAFGFYAFSAKAVVSLVMYSAIYVIMAVPLASAARAVGHGAKSASFFHGVGSSFIPLFCIFSVSFFLQFFFGLFTLIFAIFPLFLSFISIVLTQTIPEFDVDTLLKGVAASAGLLWLHSWIWAASAVALLKSDQNSERRHATAPTQVATNVDIRALRKSRE